MRLNEPDDGYADVKAPAMLDRPWPMNSWLLSMRWPDFARDGAGDRHGLRERERRQRERRRRERAPVVGIE